ncbi:MAG: geranylgeranyl reductase family protein [Anaerolineae bacterium]
MSKPYDTVIIGAGPGGSAAAYYLARQGFDVLLLDKFDFPRDKTCGDALSPRALGVLDDMGLLGEMRRAGRRVNGLEVFAPNGQATAATIPQHDGRPEYALVLPRLILDNAIRERALAGGAKFEGRIRVTAVEPDGNGVVVRGGRRGRSATFKARLAIIATGASPKLLLQMGLLPRQPPMILAARSYFEEVKGLGDQMHFRFDGVPLPGYGWVFPLPDSAANIGAGFFPNGRTARRVPATPGAAFEQFIQTPSLRAILAGARQAEPVKGYPLRVDFATAPTFGARALLVGEAAGLVNPLTGEGIDYALESGRIAAEHAGHLFATGDFSPQNLAAYDRLLRQRYQNLFVFSNRMRDLFLRPFFLNRLVKAAHRQADLKMLLLNILLGNQHMSMGFSLKTLFRIFLAATTTGLR